MNTDLPDTTIIPVPEQQSHYGASFPLALQWKAPGGDLERVRGWIRSHRPALESELAKHGAVLFRGFPLATAGDFDAFVEAFGYEIFSYDDSLSNAVRLNRTPRVFTANEAPPEVTIYLHHELAQTPRHPGKLFFFCERPADEGGATALCRSDALFEKLAERQPEFTQACEKRGLLYTHVMPPENDPASGMGRSWKSTLNVANREEAERRLREIRYSWEWLPGDRLRVTTPVLPAVRTLRGGRKSFFNQLIAAYSGWKETRPVRHGDGGELDDAAARDAAALGESMTLNHAWRAGDVVLVDNYSVMHGRRPFKGVRKILASLAADR